MKDKETLCCDSVMQTQLDPVEEFDVNPHRTIGILANDPESDETRFLLTPEACGLLTSGGWKVVMERGAAIDISFDDEHYEEYGVEIVDRDAVLRAPIIVSYLMPGIKDIEKMSEGVTVLCMSIEELFKKDVARKALDKKITVGYLEGMYSHNEEFVFANIVHELDGRTAIMYAEDALSFLGGGKGVLLGGVAGIPPCEILLIGEGRKIYTAAIAAMNIGATVTLMDNDVSALQRGRAICGSHLVTSTLHPRVLCNKIKSADVIIIDACTRSFEIPANLKRTMKPNVYILDFQQTQPSACVPRTVAMALSNVLVNFIQEIELKNGFDSMISTTPGVQSGIILYQGKITDKLLGTLLHLPSTDIGMMLSGTN